MLNGLASFMGYIRAFVESDIPAVAQLHRTVFRTEDSADPAWLDSYYMYFTRVFLENPWHDDQLPSLVCEEDAEGVVGFLGVVPRRMTMNGQRVQAAIGSQFVVAQTRHAGHVALELAEAFLSGPQDLSICDQASDLSRKIWEGLGGTTSLLHSLYWTHALRPARLALSLLRGQPRLVPFAVAAMTLAKAFDEIVTRQPQDHLSQWTPEVLAGDDLIESTVLTCLPTLVGAQSLRVEYDAPTCRWLLERARQRKGSGSLHAAVVKNRDEIVGWYVYHLERNQVATVLQVAARPDAVLAVLDQLFCEADHHGAIAVTGRSEPRYLQALSDSYCVFHRGPWVLLKARQPALLRSFETGDVWFSRLDGEWCLGF